MLNNFLGYLKSASKKFAKENNIFDIVIYGSSVKSKEIPKDIDLLLIFVNIKLKERLIIAQKFKEPLKNKIKSLDIKTINLQELFDSDFLARQNILIEGYSLLDSKYLSEKLGFKGFSLFSYSLKNLNHNQKTKFTYSLIGRNKEGMLKSIGGISLGRGAFAIPIEKSAIFEDFLKEWKVNYKENKILMSKYD